MSNEEIAEYAEGLADRATGRRVLHAALTDRSVSERLSSLETHDREYERSGGPSLAPAGAPTPAESAAGDRSRRLWASMRNATLLVAVEAPATNAVAASESAPLRQGLTEAVERVLQIGRHLLTLPCLAPATASPSPDADIHRQTVQTSDGVRIEFQQLPGASPFRLRILVDASRIQPDGGSATNYNVAYLTLEDGGSGDDGQIPDRHVLIVSLNEQGTGFADFVIGSDGGERKLPASAGACRLVSANTGTSIAELDARLRVVHFRQYGGANSGAGIRGL